jgi:hypothetical protein
VYFKEFLKNQFSLITNHLVISPYTGYTRAHRIEITGKIIAGVLPCFNRETGMHQLNKNRYDYGNLTFKDVREGNRRALETVLLNPVKGWEYTRHFGGKGAFPTWKSRNPVPPFTPVILYQTGRWKGIRFLPKLNSWKARDC